MITTKQCKKCENDKPLELFRNQSSSKDGKKSYCKECDDKYNKEHYKKNKNFRKIQASLWNDKNPKKVKQYKQDWQDKQNIIIPDKDNTNF